MWDLKPDAPAEIRGPYKPISTSVSGTQICEHLPLCAKIAHKYTIVRSHSHNDNGHNTGYHYVMTGYKADFPDGNSRVPNNHLYPSIGSIMSRELGPKTTVPPYINMPHMMCGRRCRLLRLGACAVRHRIQPRAGGLRGPGSARRSKGSTPRAQARRSRLLADMEKLERRGPSQGRAKAMSTYYQRAHDLITSPEAKKAFDHAFGAGIGSQGLRLHRPGPVRVAVAPAGRGGLPIRRRRPRRLGSSFHDLPEPGKGHAAPRRSGLQRPGQRPGSARTAGQHAGGDDGRDGPDAAASTPRRAAITGRWPRALSSPAAASSRGRSSAPPTESLRTSADPVSVEDILRTLFQQMGIDTTKIYYTPLGRPVPIVDGGKIIPGLV